MLLEKVWNLRNIIYYSNFCASVSDPDPEWNPNSNESADPDWKSESGPRQAKIVPDEKNK